MLEVSKQKLDGESHEERDSFLPQYRQMLIELVHIRRRELNYSRHIGEFSEELIREREWELDLEEARLKN
jgi:CPA1 family monovalent cation:H+ antiporter